MGSPLYHRMLEYDYGDPETLALMHKVWDGMPFMVNAFTGPCADNLDREIRDWCHDTFGPEAWPIHGKPGDWHRGNATIYGWTWFGFKTREMLQQFSDAWEVEDNSATPNREGEGT